jgi:type VI protein secretion system component VasK
MQVMQVIAFLSMLVSIGVNLGRGDWRTAAWAFFVAVWIALAWVWRQTALAAQKEAAEARAETVEVRKTAFEDGYKSGSHARAIRAGMKTWSGPPD